MTFTMYTTFFSERALKTARRVPVWSEPAQYMVPAKDPGVEGGEGTGRAGIPEGWDKGLITIKELDA